jgi:hypothetical protein
MRIVICETWPREAQHGFGTLSAAEFGHQGRGSDDAPAPVVSK